MAQSQPSKRFPLAGQAKDGFSNEKEATATCYCGAVQLKFAITSPGLVGTFMCHCNDCRKITASVITTAFIIRDSHLEHLRGQDNLTVYTQSDTIASGNDMSNFFCKTCGTLMYRRGICAPDCSLLRTGTVDDFTLHETVLKPTVENFAENRVCWLKELEGAKQFIGQESGLVSVSEVGKFCVLISELPQKHARKRL